MKNIGKKVFDVQEPTGKMNRVSAEYMQFMYSAEYYLTVLPLKEMLGRTAKYINHLDVMLDLFNDLRKTDKK